MWFSFQKSKIRVFNNFRALFKSLLIIKLINSTIWNGKPQTSLGLGGFFVNLTADFHHNSEYLIIVSTTPKKGNNFKNHKYLQRDILRINANILMVTITKVNMELQVMPKVSFQKNSRREIFELENYQCSFSFIIKEANRNQHISFPTKAPFQSLQLSATQMFCITVLMVFYVLWTLFSLLLL